MSGKDEEPIRDFPKCLECYTPGRNYFWTGDNGRNAIYFDCIGYDKITESRVVIGYGSGRRKVTLEEVNLITCIKCGNCSRAVTGDLFNEIIMTGRKIVVRER